MTDFHDPLGSQFIQQLVLIVLALGFLLILLFGVLLQNFLGIGQRPLQLAGGVTGLGGMGLVHNDRKPLIAGAHFLIDDRELLEGSNNDARPGLDGLPELLGVLVNLLHHARHMVKLVDGVLQLAVQHPAVGDDDDRLEDLLVVVIVQAGEPVGKPGDGVGLAGTGAVLNEIVLAEPLAFTSASSLVTTSNWWYRGKIIRSSFTSPVFSFLICCKWRYLCKISSRRSLHSTFSHR